MKYQDIKKFWGTNEDFSCIDVEAEDVEELSNNVYFFLLEHKKNGYTVDDTVSNLKKLVQKYKNATVIDFIKN